MKLSERSRILLALLFALAMIASALVFRGASYAPWTETALIGIALCFVVLKRPVPGR